MKECVVSSHLNSSFSLSDLSTELYPEHLSQLELQFQVGCCLSDGGRCSGLKQRVKQASDKDKYETDLGMNGGAAHYFVRLVVLLLTFKRRKKVVFLCKSFLR